MLHKSPLEYEILIFNLKSEDKNYSFWGGKEFSTSIKTSDFAMYQVEKTVEFKVENTIDFIDIIVEKLGW
ncbi:MAG: hypothetical protein CXT68_07100 [Methanobacteriota archaeon]|jgi:hypothetical protein|nr:MAG: hypothetical protein CXT68_07100 [Euryarchaeota archaeon]